MADAEVLVDAEALIAAWNERPSAANAYCCLRRLPSAALATRCHYFPMGLSPGLPHHAGH